MIRFSLYDFTLYTLDWINSHPSAQVVLLTTGLVIAVLLALRVERELRAEEDRQLARSREFARARMAYRRSITRQIRANHDPREAA